jgi:hypothetical protein
MSFTFYSEQNILVLPQDILDNMCKYTLNSDFGNIIIFYLILLNSSN